MMIRKLGLLLTAASLLLGCAPTDVTILREYTGPLPRPDRLVVYEFAVSPEEVVLDQGVSAKVADLVQGSSRTAEEIQTGRAVAAALAKHLVEELQNSGVAAFPARGVPSAGERALEVRGQFVSIDEGNRTERVVIGLGAGRTDVEAYAQLYQALDRGPMLVAAFEGDAKSGYKPGMAETMGAGAVSGHLGASAIVGGALAVGSEAFSANVDADAGRMAKDLAAKIVQFYQLHGWLE